MKNRIDCGLQHNIAVMTNIILGALLAISVNFHPKVVFL